MSAEDGKNVFYIGLMSGTSMDGIDAALVGFGEHRCRVIDTATVRYPETLREKLLHATRNPSECTVDHIGQMDRWIGECFRDAALQLLQQSGARAEEVVAIGSHGQTIRHQPRAAKPFSIQLGDAHVIAHGTGITTVADFRGRDIVAGGEGAPLAPAFHKWLFADSDSSRAVLNIGGIANVTMLSPTSDRVVGFDTGPGNSLLDGWIRSHNNEPFDRGGEWAASGTVIARLLDEMLADPYFHQAPPKSTGFEYFNGGWVRRKIREASAADERPADVQATLSELTARTIAGSILELAPDIADVLVCGGGIHNSDLMKRMQSTLAGISVTSTEPHGLHPDWVEAAAFAWLAKRCLDGKTGSLPEVTGAECRTILGIVYPVTP